jgi:large conductance mechanosensitive channel
MKKFFKDFGAFIAKGNALDLAVGLVIGTAFNAIIKSLVNDIIMPLIGMIAKTDVKSWYAVLRGTATFDVTTGQLILSQDAVLLTYGNFFQAVIDFLIIALAIFLTLKLIMSLQDKFSKIKSKLANQEEAEVKE